MNFQDASNLRIPEGYVRTIHDKNNRLLWGSVGYDVSFDGNAEQTTYSGKNLLPPTADWTQTVSGVTVTCSNGQYTFSGTATANGSTTARATIAPYTIQSGDYFHYGNTLVSESINIQVVFTDATYFATSMNVANRIVSLESHVGKTIASCRVNFASGNAFNGVAKPMILHNVSTVADYEPYVGGIASPNPDYPQAIEVVTGAQTVQVTGKNLLDTSNPGNQTNIGGMTSTWNNGAVDVKGTNTSTSFPLSNAVMLPSILKAGTTITASTKETSSVGRTIFRCLATDGTYHDAVSIEQGTRSGTLTLSYDVKGVQLYKGSVPINVYREFSISEWQIELGNQATAYEPYQSQSYEVNLGKNLLNINSLVKGGVTVSNGVATGQGQHFYASFGQNTDGVPFIKKNGQLAISLKAYTDGNQAIEANYGLVVRVIYTDGTSGIVIYCKNNETTAVQHTAITTFGKDVANIQLTYANDGGNIWHISEFQVEKGGQATSYAPYFTPIELAKIGNYQDRIYKDGEKWYVEKQVGKVVLDGSEDWSLFNAASLRYSFGTNITNKAWGTTGNFGIMCDKFTPDTSSENDQTKKDMFTCRGTTYNNRMWFFNPTGGFSGTTKAELEAEWKAKLAESPVTVYYALATPTTTEITNQTLIDQLEAVYDWVRRHGYNAQVSGNLPIIINRTALPTA